MKTFLVVLVSALVFSGAAVAKAPTSAQDGGGGQTPHVWIETYSFPYPPWTYYCRYWSDGQVTVQLSCWT